MVSPPFASPPPLPDINADWHTLDAATALRQLDSDADRGLTTATVANRLAHYGSNELQETGGRPWFTILLDQFTNLMLLMLIGVAIVSLILDLRAGVFPKDAIAIFAIVILNGILGYVQESRAERALAALKHLASPRVRGVRDNQIQDIASKELVPGDILLLEAGVQIAADGRLLEAQNLQVRESALTGEAEAVYKQATVSLAPETSVHDRVNLVFMGTEVLQGRAKVVVTRTGMGTELGRIATLLQSVEPEATPLQQRMSQLSKVLVTGSLMLVAIVVVGGILRTGDFSNFEQLLEVSLSMAVAVVPEGLPAVVTVTLAVGTQRMVRRHALIRKLPAVETLGSVTTICSDKTGTLTQNKMVVQAVWTTTQQFQVTGEGYVPQGEFIAQDTIAQDTIEQDALAQDTIALGMPEQVGDPLPDTDRFLHRDRVASPQEHRPPSSPEHRPATAIPTDLKLLLLTGLLCNDATLQRVESGWEIFGGPTEGALLVVAAKAGLEATTWATQLRRVAEIPFTSERKRMSVVGKVGPDFWEGLGRSQDDCQAEEPQDAKARRSEGVKSAAYLMFTKGSPELTLERCTDWQVGDAVERLTAAHRHRILAQNNQLALRGLRVLGLAYRPLATLPPVRGASLPENHSPLDETVWEQGLVWLGLVGMQDAPRPEVTEAVKRCRQAGIRPVMITGDHQLTAVAIARAIGIAQAGDGVLNGQELEQLTLAELEHKVPHTSVYARVAPEHKLRIVQALQRQGEFVAMTGDGVNDAPALKQADIGIAMGITGTDVSKEASDMVLLDDNFATIVAAAEEGRVVYTNIRRFIKYILGSNIGEVLTIAAAPLIGLGGVPLTPLQILWMNLVTDGLPALALAMEPAEPNVMQRPPYSPRESIFARGLGLYMIRIGMVLATLTIALMAWAYQFTHAPDYDGDPDAWKTMVFTTLCIAQMGHAIAIRSNTKLTLHLNPFSNPFLLLAVTTTIWLQLLLIYVEPLRTFFGLHWLSAFELMVCLGFSLLMFVWVEMEKLVMMGYRSRRGATGASRSS